MKDIKCPSCGKNFRIDPSSFEEILHQIKDEEFNKQIKERLLLAEEDNKKALEILKRELKIQLIEQNRAKDTEIQALESKLNFADEKKRKIKNEATNLVIKKYGKGLENRLKGTGVTPSYRSWYENDCFVSIAAGTYQEDTWSAIKWFSVNVCSESAEIMESE